MEQTIEGHIVQTTVTITCGCFFMLTEWPFLKDSFLKMGLRNNLQIFITILDTHHVHPSKLAEWTSQQLNYKEKEDTGIPDFLFCYSP